MASVDLDNNPLLQPWSGPYGLPPFAAIRAEHFEPALEAAMIGHVAELDALANNAEPPTVANTAVALDRCGAQLGHLARLFFALAAAEKSPALAEVETRVSTRLAAHAARVAQHAGVFARLDDLHARRAELGLDAATLRLVERLHLDRVRDGAKLEPGARARAAAISEELAGLHTRFSQNVLADESGWYLELSTREETAGLPDWWLAAATSAAAGLDRPEGTVVVTLSRSLIVPFLKFARHRGRREQAWAAWMARGEAENLPVIRRILELRLELARLHGEATFADYQLADTMARRPEAVAELLTTTWVPARTAALAEYEELCRIAREDGNGNGDVEPWDWRRYAEVVRRERYELDDAEVMPYLSVDNVLAAAFDCAGRLFGLRFVERLGVPVYHPDVRTFEVRQGDGDAVAGVFLFDTYARPTKRSGAWMLAYRLRDDRRPGDRAVPVVANHNNFAKAPAGRPTLLSLDDARTLFHEFGHGLHGLLSRSPYETLAGTNVLRDFVELPSQLFEHWFLVPEVLRRHARHVETGEAMPENLIDRVKRSAQFNQGFETVEYCASALVDLALHQVTDLDDLDVAAFERRQLADLGMPPAMVPRHRLPHFLHLFAGSGYASAYYVYLWAEVLDADAFDAFLEAGDPFDPVLAGRLHDSVYASGDTIEPGQAYRAFRGRDAVRRTHAARSRPAPRLAERPWPRFVASAAVRRGGTAR